MKKIKKYFLSVFLVLVSALPGFAVDPVAPSDGSETTNVVVLTEAQYAALTNNMGRLVSSFSNVVQLLEFSLDGSVTSTNLLGSAVSSLSEIQERIHKLTTSILRQPYISVRDDGSVLFSTTSSSSFSAYFNYVNQNLTQLGKLLHLFISGSADGSYDASYYNFMTLIDGLSDLLDAIDDLNVFLRENLTEIRSDLSVSRAYIENIYDFLVAQLPYMTDIMQGGTNQLQTIIYIITNLTDRSYTNVLDRQFDAISNVLADLSDNAQTASGYLSTIADKIGSGSGGFPGSGSSSNNFPNIDKWIKEWVDRYYYPADSSNVFQLRYGQLIYKEQFMEGVMNFKVPFFYPGPLPTDTYRAIPFEDPKWEHAFYNTIEAYNSGHTNYYDIVSALLTDIQSVNAQNYALFYVLATNILLQSADADVSETQQDVDSLQEKIDSYQSDVETMKTDLEYKFNSLKSKYEDIKEKSDQIFSYLGGLARLPTTDYYFDLPKLQLGEDLEFGGMEIILPLTNQHLVMVAEILRFFSICLYWGLFLSMLYFAARGVVRMFLLLFKFMIYMGAIGTDK